MRSVPTLAATAALLLCGSAHGASPEAERLAALLANPTHTVLGHVPHTGELGCLHCAAMRRAALAGQAPPRAGDRAENLTDTDVLHYDLDIEIDPSDETIAGDNTITVSSLVDGLTAFEVRLSSSFPDANTSALVNGVPAPWTRLSPTTLRVTLDRAYDTGETFDVTIAYDGPAVGGGFGSIVWANDNWGRPWVYTLSETDFAHTWWPVKEDNTDKSTADLRFTVPSAMTLASNGALLANTDNGDGTRTFHYNTQYQTATYLYCFGLAHYATNTGFYTHPGGVMPVSYYVINSYNVGLVVDYWDVCEQMLPVFAQLFGEYPFVDEKYGMYLFGFSGGMEHQTMTGQGVLNESVTAHELGHQWFGDEVTCATWNHIWLNEGLATYSEALWEEFRNGSSDPAARKAAMAARKPSNHNGSVYVTDTTDINRIFSGNFSYFKGAWVTHMLRGVLGDDDFFQLLLDYRAAFAGGAATTEDLQALAETLHGSSLDYFFQQWIYGIGAPSYRSAVAAHEVGGQHYAEVYVSQTQQAPWPSVFPMPVDASIATAGGDVDVSLWNDARTEHHLVPVPAPPTGVSLDPDEWILNTGNLGTTFVPGPPKIVAAAPAPGEADHPAAGPLTVGFHKQVTIGPGDVSLVGDTTGPVSVDVQYDAPTFTATITPLAPLPGDDYTLTIADTVVAGDSGLALDGELSPGAPLPSGDAEPGGDALIAFTVAAPPACVADLTGDGSTLLDDFGIFSSNFGQNVAPGTSGDFTGDGSVLLEDFSIFAADFGCVP